MIDLALFYVSGSSSDIFFTLVAFILYALITFISDIVETTEKAYTDTRTGLTNKARWNELMNADAAADQPIAIIMLDLNGLKKVNDTLGHDAGDRLILAFSRILRRSLPKDSVICRWGGDEFAVMMMDPGKETVEGCMESIRQAVHEHNAQKDELPIFYAAGWVLSEEHPGLSRVELLSKADSLMYQNKRKWYLEKRDMGGE